MRKLSILSLISVVFGFVLMSDIAMSIVTDADTNTRSLSPLDASVTKDYWF